MMNLDHRNETLDRLWAATRPEEPSADAFDRLWVEVQARAAEPEILPFTPPATWKRWGVGLAVVAQAAALLVAGIMALRQPKPSQATQDAPLASTDKSPRVPEISLAVGMTGILGLDSRGQVKGFREQPQTPQSDVDVVPAELDVLAFMESYE